MPVVAVANRKGGVGKSTLTVNLAACLAELGERVLVLDLDPQAAATYHLGVDYSGRPTLAEVLTDGVQLEAVVVETAFGVDVAPGSPLLAASETRLVSEAGREFLLQEALGDASEWWSWVLIDTAPSLGVLTLNALTAAECILIPAVPQFACVEPVAMTLETVGSVRKRLNKGLRVLGVVPNLVERNIRSVSEVLRRVEELGVPVLPTHVRKSVRLADALGFQQPMTAFDPRHPACGDLRELTKEVVRRAIEA
jgi:chromosome partitioning protein